jgi:hypothetical protein
MASTEGYVTSPGSRSSDPTRTGDGPSDRRSSDEIRRSIEQQRNDLDVTAEALHRKLAPRELAEQLWTDMRTRVSSGAGDMVGVMKRHPVPLGLIGAGIAWWIYETSSGRGYAFGNGRHHEDESLGVGSMSTGSYRPSSGYDSEDDDAYAEGDRGWRQRSMDMAHRSKEMAQRSGERLRSGAVQARQGFSDAIDKNPLALGAACFSLGLLAAIAVPASRWENEKMGETRDRVTRRARQAAKRAAVDAAEQGARAAQDAAERIKEEALRPPSSFNPARQRDESQGREDWRKEPGSSGGYGAASSSTSGYRGATGTSTSGVKKTGSESDAPDPWDPNRSSP